MRTLTLMLVGMMAVGTSGVLALACSSDPAVVPGDDDGDDESSSSSSGRNSSGSSGTSSGGTSSGSSSGDVECRSSLKPSASTGPYCPFLTKSDGGAGGSCALGQTCCNGRTAAGGTGFDPSSCVDSAADCPPPSDSAQQIEAYECTETSDCIDDSAPPAGDAGSDASAPSGGQVCCVIPNPLKDDSTIGQGPNRFTCNVLLGEYGTRCRTSCGDRELQACEADSDCATGKKCNIASTGPGDAIYMGVCE